jgi:hypothetical protein
MPSYARLSRQLLLAYASPLIAAAARQFSDSVVHDACEAAADAAEALALATKDRQVISTRLSGRVSAVAAEEASLDRRVHALARVLDGLAELGLRAADELGLHLFPEGAGAVTRPQGRAQAPAYLRLAALLDEVHALAEEARVGPECATLAADLRAGCAAALDKDEAHERVSSGAQQAAAAADALRQALGHLDRAVDLVAGGQQSPRYQEWARVVQHLG